MNTIISNNHTIYYIDTYYLVYILSDVIIITHFSKNDIDDELKLL